MKPATKKSPKPRTASERLVAILPLVEFLTRQSARRATTFTLSNGRIPRASDEIAVDLAMRHGVGRSTIWAWYMCFERAGGCSAYAAIARRTRSDKAESRYFKDRPYVAEMVARLVFGKKLSAKAAHDSIRSHIAAPPSYATVLSEVRRLRAQRRAARLRRRREKTP